MRNHRRRRQFAAQFRDEEGILVFRYRQRGRPIEVSAAERDRAIARFVDLNRIAGWVVGTTVLLVFVASNLLLPRATIPAPMVIAAYAAIIGCWVALSHRAWNSATSGWRDRRRIGERLGWFGAMLMRIEQHRWRDLVAGAAVPMALFAMLADGTGPMWTILASGAASLVTLAALALKLALSERRRFRERKRSELSRARRD